MDDIIEICNNVDVEGGGDTVVITKTQENAFRKEFGDENIEKPELKCKVEFPDGGKIKIIGAITIENTGKTEVVVGGKGTAQESGGGGGGGGNEPETKLQNTSIFSLISGVPVYAGTEGVESTEAKPRATEMMKRRKKFILRISFVVLLAFLFTYGIMFTCLFLIDVRLNIAYFKYVCVYLSLVAYTIVAIIFFYCHKWFRGKTGQIIAVIPLIILCVLCSFIYATVFIRSKIILTAYPIIGTGVDVGIVILAAIYTKIDFTKRNKALGFTCLCSLVFIHCSFLGFELLLFRPWLVCCIRDLLLFILFNLYLWQHLQMIIGAETFKIYTENYIPAATLVYVDISIIFYSIIETNAKYCKFGPYKLN